MCEGIFRQCAQKHAYGQRPFGVNFHEVSIGPLHFLLQIRMLLRLTPALGGDGTVCGIIIMNDTGSDFLTFVTTDLPLLGNIQGYAGRLLPTGHP
jgi:hypothetical protein